MIWRRGIYVRKIVHNHGCWFDILNFNDRDSRLNKLRSFKGISIVNIYKITY